ncbi:VWA domain-containing protein, partial [Pseudochelatococcus lubricantis]|uniref:VWA domain-containing protein n=1 Tax=Pseudochelatococcus lubricantis TaxID=1538102 RepID=UPI0035E57666
LTDYDNQPASGTLSVKIVDDVPAVTIAAAVGDGDDTVEETATISGKWTLVEGADGVTNQNLKVVVDGNEKTFDGNGKAEFDTAAGHLTVSNTGTWAFAAAAVDSTKTVEFKITAVDGDGDSAQDSHKIIVTDVFNPSLLVVGSNTDDQGNNQEPHVIKREDGKDQSPTGRGTIAGGNGADVLIGDIGGIGAGKGQSLNLVLVLDTSGSMNDSMGGGKSRLDVLEEAVNNLVTVLGKSQAENIRVRLIQFDRDDSGTAETIDIRQNGQPVLSAQKDVSDWLKDLETANATNYEAGLQSALEYISTNQPLGAALNPQNKVLFISDGQPNTWYTGDSKTPSNTSNNATGNETATRHIEGGNEVGDHVAEVTEIYNRGYTIDAIGIGLTQANLTYLHRVEGSGLGIPDAVATNINTAQELEKEIGELSGSAALTAAGNDTFDAGAGNDIIFGDTVFTDVLRGTAAANGLNVTSLPEGSGWAVFTALEASSIDFRSTSLAQYADATTGKWTAEATERYVRAKHEELSAESTLNGKGRDGGNDIINGGDGNDTIYGQEGNDTINGGAGDDIIYGGTGVDKLTGGSGADIFGFRAGETGITAATVDEITDFATGVDKIKTGLAGSGANYAEGTAADFSGALAAANTAIGGAIKYYFAGVGADGYLFYDRNGDGNADEAIKLTGVGVNGFDSSDIIA